MNNQNEQYKPINRENLQVVVNKLKTALNPFIINDSYSDYTAIKIITDIEYETYDPISFSVKCYNELSGENKTIFTTGYVAMPDEFCTTNIGSSKIEQLGAKWESSKLVIILVPEEDSNILKTEAEVFNCSDNKNHITSIEYVYSSDYEDILQEITGDLDVNFSYILQTGANSSITIENGVNRSEPINTIYHSVDALKLTHPLNIKIKGVDSNDSSKVVFESNSVPIDTGIEDSVTIQASVNTDQISELVLDELEIPVAKYESVGGITLISEEMDSNKFPVELDENNGAYVDLNNYKPDINIDRHRYIYMEDASAEHPLLGEIVQYIGTTTSQYVHGYYYMRAKEVVAGSLRRPTKWTDVDPQTTAETLQSALTEYNRQNDHCLVVDTPLYITPNLSEVGTIISSTEFIISNAVYSSTLTYADILQWGIQIASLYLTVTDLEDLPVAIIDLRYPNQEETWVQKNVLPVINMQSALVYKGTCTWTELQSYTSTAQPGDFWTVSDKANQEYFFTKTGTWEFMGDIFDPYEAGDGIAITSTHDISVKYDNSTIKKNSSGNLYVDGVLTDTQADWTESNSSSPAYINHKPIIPTVNDATVVFSALGNDSDKFAQFTLNQGSDTEIIIKEGANIKLYPDLSSNQLAIEAVDTTYGDFAGSSHGLVPSASSGDSTKFLKGDGTWATPSGTGLTGVTFNGTAATVTSGVAAITASVGDVNVIETVKVNGSALTPDANKAVDITVPQGTVTSVSAGVGLTTSDGNAITSSGTVKAKLRSESIVNLTAALGDTPNRQYAVELDTDGYLSVNVPWTDNNDNTTYSFSLSGNTLTITPSSGSVTSYTPTLNPGTVTSVTAGKGLLGGTITSSGTIDLDTTVSTLTPDSLTNSVTINSSSNRYVRVSVLSGDNLTINVEMTTSQQSTPKYVKEVVVRIDNVSTGESSPANIKVNQLGTGTLKNMYNINITGSAGCNIYDGDTLELVFTFWDNDDVTFNGGVNV